MPAISDTLKQRGTTHGDFEDNARISQNLKNYLREEREIIHPNSPFTAIQQEALDMICAKLCRIISAESDNPDNWHDIAGYATLAERAT